MNDPSLTIRERFSKMSLEMLCAKTLEHQELDSLGYAQEEMVSRLVQSGYLESSSQGFVGAALSPYKLTKL